MPRGLDSSITDELDAVTGDLPLYAVRITRKDDTLFWAQAGDGTGADDNCLVIDGDNYEARLIAISGLEFSPNDAGQISITAANVDGTVTTLERDEAFQGCKIEVIEYLPTIDEFSVRWAGYCDDISELTQESATIPAYPAGGTPQVIVPKALVALPCRWKFADGVHCKYQSSGTIGFTTVIVDGAIDGTSDPVSIRVTALADGRSFAVGHEVIIDSERLTITAVDPVSGGKQFFEASRAQRGTTIATHSIGAAVTFANCFFSVDDCKAHGMYGNNFPTDETADGVARNYFGGFPLITGWSAGYFRSVKGGKPSAQRLDFSGNDSAYGIPLGMPFGQCRINDAALLLAKPEGDFLATLWAVCSGILAENNTDNTHGVRSRAYIGGSATPSLDRPHIYVNGASRHDPQSSYGIEIYNGEQDVPSPLTFFSNVEDFDDFALGFWGTARIALRINTKDNPSVDLKSQSISGGFEIQYGVLVRVYSDAVTYVEKWCEANPAWVLMHVMTDKTAGEGLDHARLNIQSFYDFATHCSENVTSTVDGSSVSRWTFNGNVSQRKSSQEWRHLISIGAYALPPFLDKDGLLKVKPLKSETLSGLPLFSSRVATSARNILWEGSRSSLRKSRRPLSEIPNEIRVTFVDKETFAKITIIVVSREAQAEFGEKSGDDSIRAVPKSIDLPGTSTVDEAARIGTLILRAGEFGQGGLSNNCRVVFKTFYRDSADIELGDVIEVEDDLLDATENEQYFRVVRISDQSSPVGTGNRFYFTREIEAVLHDNDIYDDTAFTVTDFTHVDGGGGNDKQPPPVTNLAVTESGAFDGNNKPISQLAITFDLPVPIENFRSAVVFMSTDDAGDPAGDWRPMGELMDDNGTIQVPIESPVALKHFAIVSRALSGHVGDIESLDSADAFVYPRVSLTVDGITDALDAPTNVLAYGRKERIFITWDEYPDNTETTLKALLRNYEVWRNTSNTSAGATQLPSNGRNNWYIDDSDDIRTNPSTEYYYFVRGVSILGAPGSFSAATSSNGDNPGTDGAVPDAPTVSAVRSLPKQIIIGVTPGATNQDTVESYEIQISTDNTFVSFPTGNSLNEIIAHKLPTIVQFDFDHPGVYYVRARAINIFGNSSWSGTLTYDTDATLNAADTDVPDAPTGIALVTSSAGTPIAGNAYQAQFSYGPNNVSSVWGWSCFLHSSTTLPSPTTAYDSSSSGGTLTLTPGSVRFTVSGHTFTANQWTSPDEHDLIVFSSKRSGSPQWSLEAMIYCGKISANGTNYIDIDFPVERQIYSASGLKFYIVKRGVGNHVWEKCKAAKIHQPDRNDLRAVRTVDFTLQATGLYAFAVLHGEAWGAGKLTSASGSATFLGLTAAEIKDSILDTSKFAADYTPVQKVAVLPALPNASYPQGMVVYLTGDAKLYRSTGSAWTKAADGGDLVAGSVTADKITVSDLSAISANIGTITAGTITGIVIRTAASGARVVLDSTDGFQAYDSGGSLIVRIPVSGGSAGYLFAPSIKGISGDLDLFDNTGANSVNITATIVGVYIGGSGNLLVGSTTVDVLGSADLYVHNKLYVNTTPGTSLASFLGSWFGKSVVLANSTGLFSELADATTRRSMFSLDSSDVVTFGDSSGTAGSTGIDYMKFKAAGGELMRVDRNATSTQTAIMVYQDGSLRRIQTDYLNLGTGGKNYLYVA